MKTMKIENRISAIRTELTEMIRAAVEASGCIGTFYKNKSVHHTDYLPFKEDNADEYDDSPVVAIKNETYNCYGGFEGKTVFDLFIDPEDGKLLATLNGEAGTDFDEPVGHIQVEGLMAIVEWLRKYGFIEAVAENPWRCEECGTLEIQRQGWIDPNTNEFIGYTGCGDKDDNWCIDCEEETKQIRESELLASIEEWWMFIEGIVKEGITGIEYDRFHTDDSDNELQNADKLFITACELWWSKKSTEEKIEIWKDNK